MPSQEADGTDAEIDDRMLLLMGGGGGATSLLAFTMVGWIVFDDIVYGGIGGLFAGVGSYLFIPWFVGLSAAQETADTDISVSDAAERVSRNSRLGVFGFGLEAGAIVMIVVGILLDGADLLVGVPAALTVALAAYFVGSVVLGR
ncbi:MAG: hypothetical protein PPP55_07625 [Halorubrum sp.]